MNNTNCISKDLISEAKRYPITTYLESVGILPINATGNQLLYTSPIANENTPSFYVELIKNVFYDFSSGEKGDVIRLVGLLEKCNFLEAVEKLRNSRFKPPFSFSGHSIGKVGSKALQIKEIRHLDHPKLIDYIIKRDISPDLAFEYLKEIHFENDGKRYFAIGFQNESGGYELRNGLGFKGKTSNGITVYDMGTDSVSIFEGFFDFLSALQYYKLPKPTITSIILNTTNNLRYALPFLTGKKTINCFLDNDKSGYSAVNQLIKLGFFVRNMFEFLYPRSKDFNDFLNENRSQRVNPF